MFLSAKLCIFTLNIYNQKVFNMKRNLQESSLSRIWQHINNGDTFAVISAYASNLSEEKNLERHEKLRDDIKSLRLGYIEQKSGYTYFETGEIIQEKSFFIPEITLAVALGLGRKYNQETIIFKNNDRFVLIRPDNKQVEMTFSKRTDMDKKSERPLTFEPEVLKYAYSSLLKANENNKAPYAFKVDDDNVEVQDIQEMVVFSKKGTLSESKWISIFK